MQYIILAPDVVPYLMEAQGEVRNTSDLLAGLEASLSQMEHVIDALLEKTTFIGNASRNGITMLNDAFANGKELPHGLHLTMLT